MRATRLHRFPIAAVALAVLTLGLQVPVARGTPRATASGVVYGYDPAGRLTSVTTPQGSATYAYDDAGNLLSVTRSASRPGSTGADAPPRPAGPHVDSVSPRLVRPWKRVAITGTGFGHDPLLDRVRIGGLEARVAFASQTKLVAVAPPGTAGGAVTVITPRGVATATTRVSIVRPRSPARAPTPTPPFAAPLRAASGSTALAGRILQLDASPLEGVRVSIQGRRATTDGQGRFLVTNLRPGHAELFIDARLPAGGKDHGVYEEGVDVTSGRTSVLPWVIWLPRLDLAHAITIPSPTPKPIVYTTPAIPGLEIHIPAGTVIHDHWGKVVHRLSLTPIPIDRTPLPLAPGMPLFYTIQPSDSVIGGQGLEVVYPNVAHALPRSRVAFEEADAARPGYGWYSYGVGRVTADGRRVVPPAGARLHYIGAHSVSYYALCILTLGLLCPKPGNGPTDGDPVDLGSGLFTHSHTDLALPDVLPISITRTYRQGDQELRAFGYSQSDNLDLFISPDGQGDYDLQLPDGGDVTFAPSSTTPYGYMAQGTPTGYVGATLQKLNERDFVVRLTDGTQYTFGTYHPLLTSITDRHGNTISIQRDFNSGQLQQVTSPNGRWLAFTYGVCITGSAPASCVTRVTDNIGRSVVYDYDGQGRLITVTDPAINSTTYTWGVGSCSQGEPSCTQIVSIRDPRNITYLTTLYNATDGRVQQQTRADGGAYRFVYTVGGNNQVTGADVTDPRHFHRTVTYDSSGFASTDTAAAGTSVAQTTTWTRDPSTHLVTDSVDALGRDTHFVYDVLGNVRSIVRLYNTAAAAQVSFTYESTFNRLATVADPLTHTGSVAYDDVRGTITATDPLGRQSITTTSRGQPTSTIDPLGHATYMSYLYGDLVALTDAAGDVTTRYLDGAGRMLQSTDPRGYVTSYEVDPLNQVLSVTDPLGNVTAVRYDANGNVIRVTDPNHNGTTYVPDSMDRVKTMSDALGKSTAYTYDKLDNLTKLTDRNGIVTIRAFDALNRVSSVKFGVSGTTSQSTVTYTYDAGNRIKVVSDSASGTYSEDHDGFDRLTSQSGPTGTVTYTYDLAGRRRSMTVGGQPQVAYMFDDDNELRSVSNGTQTVTIDYDPAGRRSSVVLSDGIVQTYSYDVANRISQIAYTRGTTSLGALTYGYDRGGNRTSIGGTLAAVDLPEATTTAPTYNADNELTSFNGAILTYDREGRLRSDGTNTYAWDARGQLASIGGGVVASFKYDPFGRRLQRTAGPTSTGYLYDGANVVQELNGNAPVANELTGLLVDQTFSRTDGSGTSSLLTDALGSTVALGSGSGSLTTRYTYDPYGKATPSGSLSSNPFQFTGRENDGNGLQYSRARYYGPSLGRFISQDPLGFAGGSPNLYAYAADNPVNFVDPSGKRFLASCAGGALFSVGVDLFGGLAGRKFTLGQVVTDAASGCATGIWSDFAGNGTAARELGEDFLVGMQTTWGRRVFFIGLAVAGAAACFIGGCIEALWYQAAIWAPRINPYIGFVGTLPQVAQLLWQNRQGWVDYWEEFGGHQYDLWTIPREQAHLEYA